MFTFPIIALFIKVEASKRDVKSSYNFKYNFLSILNF